MDNISEIRLAIERTNKLLGSLSRSLATLATLLTIIAFNTAIVAVMVVYA